MGSIKGKKSKEGKDTRNEGGKPGSGCHRIQEKEWHRLAGRLNAKNVFIRLFLDLSTWQSIFFFLVKYFLNGMLVIEAIKV